MIELGDLIQQASRGSTSAQLRLVSLAIDAGAAGAIRQIEALTAAETWARLAAAAGGAAENRTLAGVMLARCEFEANRRLPANADWYEAEARRVLQPFASSGDEQASAAIVALGKPKADVHTAPQPAVLVDLAAAAKGDLNALAALHDMSDENLAQRFSETWEALTAGELYARLGAQSGDAGHIKRLAGTLLKRADQEYQDGIVALGDNAVAEAAVLLALLIDTGDRSVSQWLAMIVDNCARRVVARAALHRPTILAFMAPEGAC